eukprot:Skav216118  [mRNA]  locus=scaffold1946:186037:187461:+ [translate_table: standard]
MSARIRPTQAPTPIGQGEPKTVFAVPRKDAKESFEATDGGKYHDARYEKHKSRDEWSESRKWSTNKWNDQWSSYSDQRRKFHGTMDLDKGPYGFILQDAVDGEEPRRMFVLPWSCHDEVLPPIGSRVEYYTVTDAKTGKERAEDVIPEGTGGADSGNAWNPHPEEVCSGIFFKENDKGTCGFIRADHSGEEIFLIPSNCVGFNSALPSPGTRVTFKVESEPAQRGKKRIAHDVHPETDTDPDAERFKGVVEKNYGNYGFIKTGEDEIFVLPGSCNGRQIFEIGTHVSFRKTTCERSGKWKAEDVDVDADALTEPEHTDNESWSETGRRGILAVVKDSFGFIEMEDNQDRIFLHASKCPDREMPPVGTELQFDIFLDRDKHKPAAKNVSILSTPQPKPEKKTPWDDWKGEKAPVARRGRSYKSPELAILWKKYCDENADGQYDVEEHSAFFLRQFLHDVLPEDVADAPAAKRQRN